MEKRESPLLYVADGPQWTACLVEPMIAKDGKPTASREVAYQREMSPREVRGVRGRMDVIATQRGRAKPGERRVVVFHTRNGESLGKIVIPKGSKKVGEIKRVRRKIGWIDEDFKTRGLVQPGYSITPVFIYKP